jgi:hypothetical protein
MSGQDRDGLEINGIYGRRSETVGVMIVCMIPLLDPRREISSTGEVGRTRSVRGRG